MTKLSADGSALVYSTFLGASSEDYGYGLAVDASGAAYVTGKTGSSTFPATPGAFDTTYGGYWDAYVTKLSADGSALVYSTFLGASSEDYGYGLAVGASGAAYVTGHTLSSNFPTTPGAFDTTYDWGGAYVTKLSADGSALAYSTFVGGSFDTGWGLAVDASGAAYVTGEAWSSDFPTTPGAFDTTRNGYAEAFVTKLAADGSALVYSTFLGGGYHDYGYGLALDANGVAYVTGTTMSSDLPTTPGAFDTTGHGFLSNDTEVFVTKLSADGSALVYSTFLGSNSYEDGYGLAVDASGAAYVTGRLAAGRGFPTTPGAFDTTPNGTDAFVTKFDIGDAPPGIALIATATPTTVAAGGSFTVDYTVTNNTDAAVTGDLFFTASSSAGRVGRGMILPNTPVAAHASTTGSFTQLVPATAAPGVYTYTLRIGRAPGKTQDKVVFTITVTAPARAGSGASAWQAVQPH